jgi:peptidoglycan/LPS O-acetylase OafA/YrhL
VLHHAYLSSPFHMLSLGYLGVTYFFVLSGFVLTWSQSARYGAGTFYRHRFARIGPLHYLTLVVAVVVPLNVVPSLATLIQNLTFTQAWTFDGTRSFNWVSGRCPARPSSTCSSRC